MPLYKILLPPLKTDRLIEEDTVELSQEAAAPLIQGGVVQPVEPAVKEAKPADKLKAPKSQSES